VVSLAQKQSFTLLPSFAESPVFNEGSTPTSHKAASVKGAWDDWSRTEKMYSTDEFESMDGGAEGDLGIEPKGQKPTGGSWR